MLLLVEISHSQFETEDLWVQAEVRASCITVFLSDSILRLFHFAPH